VATAHSGFHAVAMHVSTFVSTGTVNMRSAAVPSLGKVATQMLLMNGV
jgi:hypothetical protein